MTQTIAATHRRPEHSVLGPVRFLPGYDFALHDFALHDLVVMASHLVAQALIAAGVLRILRTERW